MSTLEDDLQGPLVDDADEALSDRLVTLESLPSVIREGYENGELNITRR